MEDRHTPAGPLGLFSVFEPDPALHPLVEPSLFYAPPYERMIEDEFAWHLVKYLNPVSGLEYQARAETPCAPFWIDFVVAFGPRRFGFEVGELEPGVDEEQARLRAALLVGSGCVDVLYRLRGNDLVHRLSDCLYVVAQWEPELFSRRGHINLHTLASEEARACRPWQGAPTARVAYTPRSTQGRSEDDTFAWPAPPAQDLVLHRLGQDHPAAWLRDYDQALSHFGVSDERLRQRWARSA